MKRNLTICSIFHLYFLLEILNLHVLQLLHLKDLLFHSPFHTELLVFHVPSWVPCLMFLKPAAKYKSLAPHIFKSLYLLPYQLYKVSEKKKAAFSLRWKNILVSAEILQVCWCSAQPYCLLLSCVILGWEPGAYKLLPLTLSLVVLCAFHDFLADILGSSLFLFTGVFSAYFLFPFLKCITYLCLEFT